MTTPDEQPTPAAPRRKPVVVIGPRAAPAGATASDASQPPLGRPFSDDIAYVAPIGAFLILTQVGVTWHSLYVASYVSKAILTALLLILLRRHYTKIRWNHWWLGAALGVVGLVQWVGMERLLLHWFHGPYPRLNVEPVDLLYHFGSPAQAWTFIAIRWASASLVVPVMEELFWRDFLWRSVAAPNDFKAVGVGVRSIKALVIVTLLFSTVHVQWPVAIVWGLMIGGLLLYTRSLGACIVMHGVTNFLLGLYVLMYRDWQFW